MTIYLLPTFTFEWVTEGDESYSELEGFFDGRRRGFKKKDYPIEGLMAMR